MNTNDFYRNMMRLLLRPVGENSIDDILMESLNEKYQNSSNFDKKINIEIFEISRIIDNIPTTYILYIFFEHSFPSAFPILLFSLLDS